MKSTIYSGQHIAHQCSISESSFDDVNLQKSLFNNVNLHKSIFTGISLDHSNFYNVNLSCTQFSYINLGGVCFSNISSTSANHAGELKSNPVHFIDSDLSESSFVSTSFKNASFENCNIEGLVINGVNIEALINATSEKPELKKIGWRTQNETGSTNKVSKKHFVVGGNDKTLCGVEVPDIEKVAEMSEEIGTDSCKRCLNIKKTY